MKTTLSVARVELKTLFYSPVAWLVLTVFAFQTGYAFADVIQRSVGYLIENDHNTFSLTTDIANIIRDLQNTVYLYIPLLTMGLMSREIGSGSIKLLYSSPVSVSSIILGKYLAVIILGFCLVGILLLFSLFAAGIIVSANVELLLSAITGIYLLICTYCAIGLLMSSLTSYPAVAALLTLASLAILNYASEWSQYHYSLTTIGNYLSVKGRMDSFCKGLIISRNFIYFLIVIILSIGLNILIISIKKRTKPIWQIVAIYAALAIFCGMIAIKTNKPSLTWYCDVTSDQSQTLAPRNQQLFRQLKQPLKVHTYVNLLDGSFGMFGTPSQRSKDPALFEDYQRFLANEIQYTYTYYYDSVENDFLYKQYPGMNALDVARQIAKINGIDFSEVLDRAQMAAKVNLKGEGNKFVRQLEYQGHTTFLRVFWGLNPWPSEDEVAAAVKRLLSAYPVIGLLTGHNERSAIKKTQNSYHTILSEINIRGALINQGFDVKEIDADSLKFHPEVSILLIADPRFPYSDKELSAITDYISQGKNLAIFGESTKQGVLNPLLTNIGVQLSIGQVRQSNERSSHDVIIGQTVDTSLEYITPNDVVAFNGASAINTATGSSSFKFTSFVTAKRASLKKSDSGGEQIADINGSANISSFISKDISAGPQELSSAVIAAKLERNVLGKTQRIIVVGDADFITVDELLGPDYHNGDFFLQSAKWLANGEFPIHTTARDYPKPLDTDLNIDRKSTGIISLISMILIPGLFLVYGVRVLRRRKNQ
jgi:ABC-2 type transport system permease protein